MPTSVPADSYQQSVHELIHKAEGLARSGVAAGISPGRVAEVFDTIAHWLLDLPIPFVLADPSTFRPECGD